MVKKNTSTIAEKVATGMGIAGAIGAVAGSLFLYGTKAGAMQRKKIKGWSVKMKGEVLEKLENLKDITEEKYQATIDAVAVRYQRVKTIDPDELSALVNDLKKHWRNIKGHIDGKKPKARPKAKKEEVTK
jgi:gas vesicle protein